MMQPFALVRSSSIRVVDVLEAEVALAFESVII